MYKLIQGNSLDFFKNNDIKNISLILCSPPYYSNEAKRNSLNNEIGTGESKEKYINLISEILKLSSKGLTKKGKIVLLLGRYNDVSIKSMILMLENELLKYNLFLISYKLSGKGNHESIVIFSKNEKENFIIPNYSQLQIYDKVGFFGRINPAILEWAINTFTLKNELVVDPFAGSGSTIKKADYMKRNGLGIELNPKYIN